MQSKTNGSDDLTSASSDTDQSEPNLAETTDMPSDAATTDTSSDPFRTIASPRKTSDITRRLIGRYTVVGKLGSGGQADVFRAVHPTLPIEVAIKLSHRQFDLAARESLTAEAHILCDLDHPNIAKIRDFDFMDGQPFMVLDFIRGQSLAQLAQAVPLSQADAANLVAKLARAIAFANAQGVIHRDLKPENVVIDEKGEPKIIDFGMSRLRSAMDSETPEANEVSGTLVYMSPEQAHGIASKTDHRVDVFALGGILYRLLVGKQPYPRLPIRELHGLVRQGNWDPAALDDADVADELKIICRRAMHRDPAERFATADALADALLKSVTQTGNKLNAEVDSSVSTKRTLRFAGSSLGCDVSVTMAFSLLVLMPGYTILSHVTDREMVPILASNSDDVAGFYVGSSAGKASPPIPQSLIERFEIIHIGNLAEQAEFSSPLLESRPPRENDSIQVKAEFTSPVYCMLVALNPDGVKQLCYPIDGDTPQVEPITTLSYPAEETVAFGLTDGVGQQAFILVASPNPLPAFSDWKRELTFTAWPNPDNVGNWTYTNGELVSLNNAVAPQKANKPDAVSETTIPTPFEELCDRLRVNSTTEVAGVMFEIRPWSADRREKHQHLQKLFRSLVVDVTPVRGVVQKRLTDYLKADTLQSTDWVSLRKYATQNQEQLEVTLDLLREVEDDFVANQIETFRGLAEVLRRKQSLYTRLLAITDPPADRDVNDIKAIATEYTQALADLKKYELAIEQYLYVK